MPKKAYTKKPRKGDHAGKGGRARFNKIDDIVSEAESGETKFPRGQSDASTPKSPKGSERTKD